MVRTGFRKLFYKYKLLKWVLHFLYYRQITRWLKHDINLIQSEDFKDKADWSSTLIKCETIKFIPAISFKNSLNEQFRFFEGKTFSLRNINLGRFYKAYLIGPEAVGISKEGAIIIDTVLNRKSLVMKCSPRLIQNHQNLKTDRHIEHAISLINIYVNNHYVNYFHWLLETLPLLYLVQFIDIKPKLVVNQRLTDYQIDTLHYFNYSEDDLIYWDYQKVNVENLYVMSTIRTPCEWDEVFSPTVLKWLRGKFISADAPKNKRIYISRGKSGSRRVINEPELVELLKTFGFLTVYLEDLTFKEQVSLMQESEIIVSSHGAGLTNMLFSKEATIIELLGNLEGKPPYYYSLYYLLTQSLGLRYAYLECPYIALQQPVKQGYDIIVLLDDLEKLLSRFI